MTEVLDIGGSDGKFCDVFLRKNKDSACHLLEPYPKEMLVQKESTSRFLLIKEFFENNTLRDSFYDAVTMLDVFEHVKKESLVAREISRVLKKGGLLVVSVPNSCFYDFLDPANTLGYVRYIFEKISGRKRVHYEKHRHYSLKKLESFFLGFGVERVEYRGTLFGVLLKYFLHPRMLIFLPKKVTAFKKKLERGDYGRSWGRHSYHLIVVLKKK